jgi:hypothetical protein
VPARVQVVKSMMLHAKRLRIFALPALFVIGRLHGRYTSHYAYTGSRTMVHGIITSGRGNAAQWVTSFAASAYVGMRNFSMRDKTTGADNFAGNSDSSTQAISVFSVPTEMR